MEQPLQPIKPKKKQSLLPWSDYPFLCFAFSKTIRAPLEVIRIRYQCDNFLHQSGLIPSPYTSSWNCFRHTISQEGKKTLWKGHAASLLMYLPDQLVENCLSNYIEKVENRLTYDMEHDGYIKWRAGQLVADGVKGTITKTFTYSLDYAKTRLINDIGNKHYQNVIDVYRKTLSNHGFLGLYRGFYVSLSGMIIYKILHSVLEDILVGFLLENPEKSTFLKFSLGILSMILAGVLTTPLDTVKRRMMMASGDEEIKRGMIEWLKHIAKNEGVRGLFKGASFTAVITAASAAVLLPVFIICGFALIRMTIGNLLTTKEKIEMEVKEKDGEKKGEEK